MFYKSLLFYPLCFTQNLPLTPLDYFFYEYVFRSHNNILDDVDEQFSLSGREISKCIFISLNFRGEWVEKHQARNCQKN